MMLTSKTFHYVASAIIVGYVLLLLNVGIRTSGGFLLLVCHRAITVLSIIPLAGLNNIDFLSSCLIA